MTDLPADAVTADPDGPWWKYRAQWIHRSLLAGELRDPRTWDDVRRPVRMESLGRLELEGGALVAADPYLLGGEVAPEPFEQRLGVDSAEVVVARARIAEDHERVAALLLNVGTGPVAEWGMATVPGQDVTTLEGKGFFGYGVDAGVGSFGTPSAMAVAGRVLEADEGMLEDPVSEMLDRDASRSAALVAPEPGATPIAACSSGWGDGSYPTWIGYDASGAVVLVVTDFLLVDDPWQAPPAEFAHPAFATRFPPDDDTFAGSLMTEIAIGLRDRGALREQIEELIEGGEFGEFHPDEPVPTLDQAYALLDRLLAVHDKVVEERSPDLVALDRAVARLGSMGVAFSIGDGFDAREGAQAGYELALDLETDPQGYAYVHEQDLRRAVLDGRFQVGFSGMSGELGDEAVAVGRTIANCLAEVGLPVSWNADPRTRIEVGPVTWATPFESDGPTMVLSPRDLVPGGVVEPGEPALIDLAADEVVALVDTLMTADLPDDWETKEVAGVDLLHTPGGHVLGAVGVAEGEDPDGAVLAAGADLIDEVERALTDRYGAAEHRSPRPPAVETAAWLDLIMGAMEYAAAQVWQASDDAVVAVLTRRGEGVLEASVAVMPNASLSEPGALGVLAEAGWDDFVDGLAPDDLRARVEAVGAESGVAQSRVGDAVRYGWTAEGRATAWWFAADGRILVAWFDPASNLVPDTAGSSGSEALAAAEMHFAGVPDDLRELAFDARDDLLPTVTVDGRSAPLTTGVVWFDGEDWWMAPGWLQASMAVEGPDAGYVECVLVPYGLSEQ